MDDYTRAINEFDINSLRSIMERFKNELPINAIEDNHVKALEMNDENIKKLYDFCVIFSNDLSTDIEAIVYHYGDYSNISDSINSINNDLYKYLYNVSINQTENPEVGYLYDNILKGFINLYYGMYWVLAEIDTQVLFDMIDWNDRVKVPKITLQSYMCYRLAKRLYEVKDKMWKVKKEYEEIDKQFKLTIDNFKRNNFQVFNDTLKTLIDTHKKVIKCFNRIIELHENYRTYDSQTRNDMFQRYKSELGKLIEKLIIISFGI